MITQRLQDRLSEHFPDLKVRYTGSAPAIIIPAAHPDVGDVQIYDKGTEAIVFFGKFTHSHVADYDATSEDEVERNVVSQVIDLLERLFSDQIVMWGSHQSRGGWYARGQNYDRDIGLRFVWSGPLQGE